MRKEFNELVDRLKFFDLFQKGDEVDIALTNLSNKIDEVEKRIECAVRSAREVNQFVSKYTEDVYNHIPINMSVDDHDFIINRSNDIDIALDMGDDMCVVDNWYYLFEPKVEPKPIAVGNIEYDFPEAVFSIGNADNTEFVADVYDSDFAKLIEFGVIMFECDEDFIFGKANYIVKDNSFIPMVKLKEIDLSKVPIKKEIFGEAPTMQCTNLDTHDKVKQVIAILKTLDNGDCVDGETMEYILKEVGMDDQMLKQLFPLVNNDELDELLDIRNEYHSAMMRK